MFDHDAQGRYADDARRLHVLLASFDHRRTAHGTGVLNPTGQRDRDDQHAKRECVVGIRKKCTADTRNQERDQDRWEGEHHVADAHDQRVDPSTDVAGNKPQTDANQQRQQYRGAPHQQRNSCTVHEGGQHVATLLIRSEQVFRAAAEEPRPAILRCG